MEVFRELPQMNRGMSVAVLVIAQSDLACPTGRQALPQDRAYDGTSVMFLYHRLDPVTRTIVTRDRDEIVGALYLSAMTQAAAAAFRGNTARANCIQARFNVRRGEDGRLVSTGGMGLLGLFAAVGANRRDGRPVAPLILEYLDRHCGPE
jgi:hypothetical protein